MRLLPVLALALGSVQASAELPDAKQQNLRLSASQMIVADFETSLGARLKATMTTAGPVAAIAVCRDEAMPIGKAVGDRHDVTVKRITDRPRNPINMASDTELRALAALAAQREANKEQAAELLVTTAQGTRYYRAIEIKPLCLSCHGAALSADVKRALATHYPEDKATGYQPGELRGAFVVDWPNSQADRGDHENHRE
jgi:hypothetical protein